MTLPYERTRSVIQAREYLFELSRNSTLPEAVRVEAKRLLRHFPTADEVLRGGATEEHMYELTTLASGEEGLKTQMIGIFLHSPVFSSRTTWE